MHNLPFMPLPPTTFHGTSTTLLPHPLATLLAQLSTDYNCLLVFVLVAASLGVQQLQRLTSSLAMVMGMEKVAERQVERGRGTGQPCSGIVQTVVNCGLANSNSDSVWWVFDYATKCSSSGEIPVHCT